MTMRSDLAVRLVAFVESVGRKCKSCLRRGTSSCGACDATAANSLVAEIGRCRAEPQVAEVANPTPRVRGSVIRRVLVILSECKSGKTSSELKKDIGRDIGVVSQAVMRLRGKGLVESVADVRQGCPSRYRITTKGAWSLVNVEKCRRMTP